MPKIGHDYIDLKAPATRINRHNDAQASQWSSLAKCFCVLSLQGTVCFIWASENFIRPAGKRSGEGPGTKFESMQRGGSDMFSHSCTWGTLRVEHMTGIKKLLDITIYSTRKTVNLTVTSEIPSPTSSSMSSWSQVHQGKTAQLPGLDCNLCTNTARPSRGRAMMSHLLVIVFWSGISCRNARSPRCTPALVAVFRPGRRRSGLRPCLPCHASTIASRTLRCLTSAVTQMFHCFLLQWARKGRYECGSYVFKTYLWTPHLASWSCRNSLWALWAALTMCLWSLPKTSEKSTPKYPHEHFMGNVKVSLKVFKANCLPLSAGHALFEIPASSWHVAPERKTSE